MGATIDDIHHRNGQSVSVRATDIAIQGDVESLGSGLGNSQADTQDGVSAQFALGGSTIQLQHLHIDSTLVEHAITLQRGSDDGVYVLHSLQHALAAIAVLVAVTKLQSLVLAS